MCSDSTDRLYAEPLSAVEIFTFDEAVVRVFPDMIERSVPGYATLVGMIGLLARELLRPRSRCYDLGCSLGAVSYAVAQAAQDADVEIVAVDNAPAMIEQLDRRLRSEPPGLPVRTLCTDILDVDIEEASLVVLNLTLQFIAPEQRLGLLRKIHAGLLPGGALILSEKTAFDAAREQQRIDGLQQAFKRARGYSELEISQKRAALERVLIPDTVAAHRRRLKQAGFGDCVQWFQCLNFVSLLAWK
jgi:tRNA (cmo5U34)-methyltransferase